jgi:hypothetical protein
MMNLVTTSSLKNRNYLYLIFCILLTIPNLAWILLDKSSWPWDQAWYAEESIRLWHALVTHNVNWLDALLNAFHSKAPLIAWIGQFFVPLSNFIGIHEALLISIWLASLLATLISYKLSSLAFKESKNIALLVAIVVCSSPLFVGLSHEYLVEIYQVIAVAYVYWLYFASPNLSRVKIYYHILFAVTIVFGSKSSTILYCFLPMIGIIRNFFYCRISNEKINSIDLLFIVLSTSFICLIAAWYLRNLNAIYSFGVGSASGTVSLYYGKVDSFFNKFVFWMHVFEKSIITKYIIYISLIACFTLFFIKPYRKIESHKLKLAALVVLQAMIPMIFFSVSINEESRYILPILPSIAILIALLASTSKIHTYLFLAIFILQFLFVQSYSFGLHQYNQNLNHWLKNINLDPKIRNRNQDLSKHLCFNQQHILYIVGVEYIDFNFNTLAFLGSRFNTECKFTSLGFAANNVENAMNRAKELGVDRIVTFKKSCQKHEDDWLNQISKDVVIHLEKSKDYLLTENYDDCILIFRRIK